MSEYHDAETGEVFEPQGSYRRSEQIAELFSALAKAQGQFEMAERAGENEGFRRGGRPSTYATLAAALEATKEGRVANGLALIQIPSNGDGNNIAVTTILGHSSGQWIESTFSVAPLKFDAQGAGSVITYLRRYAAMAILGIAPEDDDGNAAVAQPAATQGATRTAQPRRPPAPAPAARPDATSVAPSRTPSSIGNGVTPRWVGEFLARDSYEIDPTKAGGWSMWARHYLAVLNAAESAEQADKLGNDNNAHLIQFSKEEAPEIYESFCDSSDEIRAKRDHIFVSAADAQSILRG